MSDETTNEPTTDNEPAADATASEPVELDSETTAVDGPPDERPALDADVATVQTVLAEHGAAAPAHDTETLARLIVNALHDAGTVEHDGTAADPA